ncbi:autotransporter outer membrane beta-barrel domain-containing protein [Arhodomonas sp. SL1]|uniref:autotransporter outer membrane beta-barrel domain-containing protein n=1 Tax=Arhodomonas sp. SL1 TaxID=3425691 RepID=UPI003F8828AF
MVGVLLAIGISTSANGAELRVVDGLPSNVEEGAGTLQVRVGLFANESTDPEFGLDSCQIEGDLTGTGGDAGVNEDYVPGSFVLNFEGGTFVAGEQVAVASTTVAIQDDLAPEPDETAEVTPTVTNNTCTGELSNPVPGIPNSFTILDDDQAVDTAPPETPQSLSVNGLPGTTVESVFTVSDETAPLSIATNIGTVSPEVIDGTNGSVTFTFDVPAGAVPDQTFEGTITVSDGSGDGEPGNTTEIPVSVTASSAIDVEGLTPTQRAVADAVTDACDAIIALPPSERTDGNEDLLNTCGTIQSSSSAGPLLDELAHDELFTQGRLAESTARGQLSNVDQRVAKLRAGSPGVDLSGLNISIDGQAMPGQVLQAAAYEALGGGAGDQVGAGFSRWSVYANGNITRGERDRTRRESGYDADSWNITVGSDYRISDTFFVGGSVGYSRSDTDLRADSGGIDSEGISLSAYATLFEKRGYYLDAVVSYGFNSYDTSRELNVGGGSFTAEGDPDGEQYTVSLDAGYDINRGAWTIGLQGRLVYLEAEIDGYRESPSNPTVAGSGSLLEIDDQSTDSLTSELAAQVTYALSTSFGVVLPTARLGWEHQFADDSRGMAARFVNDPSSTTFRIRSDEPDRDYFNVGAGVSAQFARGRSAFVFIDWLAGHERESKYSVNAGLRMEF